MGNLEERFFSKERVSIVNSDYPFADATRDILGQKVVDENGREYVTYKGIDEVYNSANKRD